MKCRIHSTDLSSAVGVCASCLRERLFLIISAQTQHIHQLQLSNDRRNSDPQPPLDFPRSVSPYVVHRKSDGIGLDFTDRRFHSTPQIDGALEIESMKKKKRGKFSFITNLFKSRSNKSEIDPRTASTSSPLWYPTSESKSKSVPKFVGQRIQNSNQNHRVSDRGMSPERSSCYNDGEEESSSRSSESYDPPWKQTPVIPMTRRRHSNISGLAFCLSPLVRASPNQNWNGNSLAPESGRGGGGGSGVVSRKGTRLAVTNSLPKNRSKKMADFGRGGFENRR